MSKPIKTDPYVYVPEEDLMLGRNHVRELLSPAAGYDVMQYRYWKSYLTSLALSAFEWEGMPAGIDTRAIEYILLHWGLGALFMEDGGFLFAQCASSNMLNMYYNPNECVLTAPNGSMWTRHAQTYVKDGELMVPDCVVVFDNMNREPLDVYIDWYSKRLATYDRIADINIGAQRTPWIITGSEETKRTRKAWVRRLFENDQYIEINSNAGGGLGEVPQVLPTEAPFVADKIFEAKQKLLNEALTLIGVDNTNNEKRERQIVDEVLANNEQISLLRRSRMECRRSFCEKANALYHLDINVKFAAPHISEAPINRLALGGDIQGLVNSL